MPRKDVHALRERLDLPRYNCAMKLHVAAFQTPVPSVSHPPPAILSATHPCPPRHPVRLTYLSFSHLRPLTPPFSQLSIRRSHTICTFQTADCYKPFCAKTLEYCNPISGSQQNFTYWGVEAATKVCGYDDPDDPCAAPHYCTAGVRSTGTARVLAF